MSPSKVRDKQGKHVLAFEFLNFVKEILCPCNFMALCVYDISNAVTNKLSLLHNREHGVKGVLFLISLCGSFQV